MLYSKEEIAEMKEQLIGMSDEEILGRMLNDNIFSKKDIRHKNILVIFWSCVSVVYISLAIIFMMNIGVMWIFFLLPGLMCLVFIVFIRTGTRFEPIGYKFALYKTLKKQKRETSVKKLLERFDFELPSKNMSKKIEEAKRRNILISRRKYILINTFVYFMCALSWAIINYGLIFVAMREDGYDIMNLVGFAIIFGGLLLFVAFGLIYHFKFYKKVKIYAVYNKNPNTFCFIGNLNKKINDINYYHEVKIKQPQNSINSD